MKTSNKLFIAAILIIILSMVAYDFALRAEYLKGEYKSRFYEKEKLGFNGFKSIDNRAANYLPITIERGDHFGVWIDKNLKDRIKISKIGDQLIIDVIDRNSPKIIPYSNSVTIICPSINEITMQPLLLVKENQEIYPSDATTNLSGFNQQNLSLIVNESTHLSLEKNKIENLNAIVGTNSSKHAYLFIASNNQIGNANINVLGKNQLVIENPKIEKTNFTISDSANVSLGGSTLKQLRTQPK